MYNLNWTQAQEAMREGKRVKNSNFTNEEFFYMEDGKIWDEQGYPMAGWYRGYDWQDEGWMVLEDNFKPFEADVPEYVWKEEEIRLTDKERQEMKAVIGCDNFSALEDRIIASFVDGCYTADTMDYFVGIARPMPREKQNYHTFKIKKGRGHNKLQKRKKK